MVVLVTEWLDSEAARDRAWTTDRDPVAGAGVRSRLRPLATRAPHDPQDKEGVLAAVGRGSALNASKH